MFTVFTINHKSVFSICDAYVTDMCTAFGQGWLWFMKTLLHKTLIDDNDNNIKLFCVFIIYVMIHSQLGK